MTDNFQTFLSRLDELDAAALSDAFTEDATASFGSLPTFEGRTGIYEGLEALFVELDGAHHDIKDVYTTNHDDVMVATVDATFRVRGCKDAIHAPGVIVARYEDDRIAEARMSYDLTPVFRAIESPNRVFEALDETFPASDAPAWTP